MTTGRRVTLVSMLMILTLTGGPATLGVQGAATVFSLGETLFVSEKRDFGRDHDGDGLKDDLEYKLAENFKPFLVFDSDEGNRRGDEPVTLFQVRPRGCTGVGCPPPYRVVLKYGFLFRRDGGYGPSSWCKDAHNGDNQPATFLLESSNGKDWTLAQINNAAFTWPASRASGDDIGVDSIRWHQGDHPVIYMSAHKHHQYFDTSRDEDDSIYSDWGCNDDINGRGAQVFPALISPYPDKRPNNVGEPESHSPQRFIGSLNAFGYHGEDAWGTKAFTGGLEDEGATSSLRGMWDTSAFHFTGQTNWDFYDTLGGLRGRITDTEGKPIAGLKLYYRPVLVALVLKPPPGPWGTLDVDAAGNYAARLPLSSIYLLRPVASDYDFVGVPKSVSTEKGHYVVTNFQGTRTAGSTRRAPVGIVADPHRAAIALLSAEDREKLAVLEGRVLRTVAPPAQMVTLGAPPIDKEGDAVDPEVRLPRRSTLQVHVEGLLSSAGTPANTLGEVAWGPPKVFVDSMGLKHVVGPGAPALGGPVQGAKITVRLVAGSEVVDPASGEWVEATTNARGNAFLTLQTGRHPGATMVDIHLTSNPVNPWALFTLKRRRVELQPAIRGDDSVNEPKVGLLPVLVDDRRFPLTWWRSAGGLAKFADRLDGDVNLDRMVDQKDLDLVRKYHGRRLGQPDYKAAADLNNDGVIDEQDEAIVQRHMGRRRAP